MLVYGRNDVYKNPWVKEDPWQGQGAIFTPYEAMNMDYSYEAILGLDFNILNARGETVQLWSIRRSGLRCNNPQCPASQSERNAPNTNCPTCLGTGFQGGYDYRGELLMSFATDLDQITYEIGGQMRFWKPQNWTMPEPKMFTGDILFAMDRDKMLQTKMIQDEQVVRRPDNSADFDALSVNSVTRISKISNNANSSEDYQFGADYVLSNNGILWISATRPADFETYFVTYEKTDIFNQMFQVVSTNFATMRGKQLRQIVEMTALNRGHYLYEMLQFYEPAESYNYPYAFPYSEFFDRLT